MNEFLRFFIPVYFLIYLGVAFVAKSIITARNIGKSPLVLPDDDTAYGIIGKYFKTEILLILFYVLIIGFAPNFNSIFDTFLFFDKDTYKYIGIALLIFSLIWTIIAQNQMKNSWRIGIDEQTPTELITSGLFKVSRNPIFLGVLISLLGLFFVTPNTVTLLFLILGYVLIQIQIRLEEEFLTAKHGQKYLDYRKKVRRLI